MSDAFLKALSEIQSAGIQAIRQDLGAVQEALRRLGNPYLAYPVIHVAGTNGKGSTCAMIESILRQSGYKTGLTISPHLSDYTERIQINRKPISHADFVTAYEAIKPVVYDLNLTYFEWGIVLAFSFFSSRKIDVAVIETGMGGRWDATNVVTPLISIITNIGLDHQAYLGETKEKILGEKREIIKPGSHALTAIEEPDLFLSLKSFCDEIKVPLKRVTPLKKQPGLLGSHQLSNAALAVKTSEILRDKNWKITDESINEGLKKINWPGRLEWFSTSPKILLDGAHNADGIACLSAYLREQNLKVHLVFGCLNDRPLAELLAPLLPFAKTVSLPLFEAGPRSPELATLTKVTDETIAAPLKVSHNQPQLTPDGWGNFLNGISPKETVLVCGSLYLVSQVRSLIVEKL